MHNCRCPEEDPEDPRNWEESECKTCGQPFDYGPDRFGIYSPHCPTCRRKRRMAQAATAQQPKP